MQMDMMIFIEKNRKSKIPGGYLIIKMGSRSDNTIYYNRITNRVSDKSYVLAGGI